MLIEAEASPDPRSAPASCAGHPPITEHTLGLLKGCLPPSASRRQGSADHAGAIATTSRRPPTSPRLRSWVSSAQRALGAPRALAPDRSRYSEASLQALYGALISAEGELAIREGTLYAPRLARAGSGDSLIPPSGGRAWHLGIESQGTLENLRLLASPAGQEPLGEGQVRIAVHAAGLNFRDVLIALGVYPGAGAARR